MRFYKGSVAKLELGRPRATLASVWGKEIQELSQQRRGRGGAHARGASGAPASSADATGVASSSSSSLAGTGAGAVDDADGGWAGNMASAVDGRSSSLSLPDGRQTPVAAVQGNSPPDGHSPQAAQHQPRPASGAPRAGGDRKGTAAAAAAALALALHQPEGAENYSVVTAVALPDQDAYLGCWLEACLVCGGAGEEPARELLVCMDCGEAYHASCLDVPAPSAMDAYARATWRCVNCKLCELCGQAMANEEKSLLQCERCDKGYHMGCLSPPLTEAPADPWYCGGCVRCRLCRKPCPEGSWSCHPEVCHACGGFQEKNAEMRLRCPVCLEVSVLDPEEEAETAAVPLEELTEREKRRQVRACVHIRWPD